MSRATELRDAFDRSFACAPETRSAGYELLRIEVAGEPFVISLASVDAIHVDLTIVPVPATSPSLLGISALRGALLAIYDLRRLRGAATDRPPRWVAIVGDKGFAFDGFLGHARIETLPASGVVELEGRLHAVIELGEGPS